MLRRIGNIIIFLALAFVSINVKAEEITLTGQAPQTVVVGEKFKVRYTLTGAHSYEITEGTCDAISKLFGPSYATQQSHTITNGKVESSKSTTFEFIYKANKEGQFSISPAQIVVDGKTYTSNIVKLNVVADNGRNNTQNQAQDANGNIVPKSEVPDIIIRQTLDKSKVYEGETVVLTTKIYTRADLNSISDIVMPELQEFVAQDIFEGPLNFQRESLDGVVYQSAVAMQKALIPQKNGTIKIEPIEYEFVVKQRTQSRSSSFFNGFFDDVQMVRRRVKSNSLSIKVLPLPDGKPHGFSGGVGEYKFNVSVNPTTCETDNSIQVKVTVSGEGNLKLLTIPKPQFHSDFDTFDPNESNKLEATAKGYKGTRTAEYLIIPRVEGQFEIPEIKFSYFNPNSGKYVTLSQGPFTLNIKKGADSGGGTMVSAPAKGTAVVYTAHDLRYLHLWQEKLQQKGHFFVLSLPFFLIILLAVALFGGTWAYFHKKRKDSLNIDRVKMRRANKQAKKRLKVAEKLIKDGKREEFFDEVMRALWGYLSDKLTLPLSELTKDNAKSEMIKHNISEETANEFMALLDECEFARYAPADISSSMDEIYNKAINAIQNID